MNDKRYRYILYVITPVIVATIGIQIYWNIKNYESSMQQLINDVQTSLDKAIDDYYTNLAEETTLAFSFNESKDADKLFNSTSAIGSLLQDIDINEGRFKNLNTIDVSKIKGAKVFKGFKADSMMAAERKTNKSWTIDSLKNEIKGIRDSADYIELNNFQVLTSKVMVSITNDTLNLKVVDTLLKKELNRKNITIDYNINYKAPELPNGFKDSVILIEADSTNFGHDGFLSVLSESSFLPKESNLSIDFTNETAVILKRMLGGIGISTLLVLAIISCLFYMLKIIRDQKQLAEVKNDLISNITHEFKTPIATIGVALESINNFEAIDDKEKTKRYVDMSSTQLNKLNVMVEKLLETATLDSENLNLNKEQIDVVSLLDTLVNRYKTHNPNKTINSSFKVEELLVKVDVFHFENALNNILDNAMKYGGDIISIDLLPSKNTFEITISDNGTSLSKANKDQIFEKFYRVLKGNQHDVKGFGIGLFYTKSIIEKHEGRIELVLNKSLTSFKITVPNG